MMQYIPYIFYALVAAGAVYLFLKKLWLKKSGTEAEAVVTRIHADVSSDDSGNTVIKRFYIVSFRSETGQTVEATLMGEPQGLKEGSRIKVRYDPNKPKMAVMTEVIE